jgi:hypothetical protein
MTTKQWKLKNPERYKAQQKRYRDKHRQDIYAYQKEWIKNNPEKRKIIVDRSIAKHPETRRNRIYKVNISDIKNKQDGKCAICGKERFLVADHCHIKNKFRGLLCNDCNLGLGRFFDSVELLEKAKKYLINNI